MFLRMDTKEGAVRMHMRMGTKVTWIVVLSVALVAVIGMCGLVVARSVRAVGSFASNFRWNNGISVNTGFFGPVGPTNELMRVVNQDYAIHKGGQFSLSIPLGKITVIQSKTAKTIHMKANFSIVAPIHNKAASQIHLSTASAPESVQVNWDSDGGLRQLKHANVTLTVPTNLNLSLNDSLGDIRIQNGKYSSLDVRSNLGAITVNADVSQNLSLHDNLGSITVEGALASGSNIINNLGSVEVNVPRKQAIEYNLTTDLGNTSVSFPAENISERGNSVFGSVNGPGPKAVLTCTNNMGSITLQGE